MEGIRYMVYGKHPLSALDELKAQALKVVVIEMQVLP